MRVVLVLEWTPLFPDLEVGERRLRDFLLVVEFYLVDPRLRTPGMPKPLFPKMRKRGKRSWSDFLDHSFMSTWHPWLTSPRSAFSPPPSGRPRCHSGCSCTIPLNPIPWRVFACTVIRKQTRVTWVSSENRVVHSIVRKINSFQETKFIMHSITTKCHRFRVTKG